jgi:hypothetical protein
LSIIKNIYKTGKEGTPELNKDVDRDKGLNRKEKWDIYIEETGMRMDEGTRRGIKGGRAGTMVNID